MKPIFHIQRFSIHDGPGIRTTVFFQGCPLACAWCHNPESQEMLKSWEGGADGLEMALSSVLEEVEKDQLFYDDSGGGVTFSGGEPLCQPDLLMALIQACRDRGFHTCLDTAGAAPFRVLERAARAVDLVLYDLKLMDSSDHLKWMGAGNQGILKNLEELSGRSDLSGLELRLRFPLIPGITATRENQEALADFVLSRTRFRDIHILPFHNTARGKYENLDRRYLLADLKEPGPEAVARAQEFFSRRGFHVHMGGGMEEAQ